MSTLRPQDRVSLCRFTLADGRKCRTPRAGDHPHFCHYHARKESQARVADKLGNDLAYFFSGEYLSACDLTTAIGRLIPAVVRGDLKPKAATTVAYLSQTLAQAIHLAQHEYTNSFGFDYWRKVIREGVGQNLDYRYPPPLPQPSPQQAPAAPHPQGQPTANPAHAGATDQTNEQVPAPTTTAEPITVEVHAEEAAEPVTK